MFTCKSIPYYLRYILPIVGDMEHFAFGQESGVSLFPHSEYQGWCTAPNNQKLLAGDWNGDGFTDLLCYNQTGHMKVLINQAG